MRDNIIIPLFFGKLFTLTYHQPFQEWKSGQHPMGRVRPFEPNVPEAANQNVKLEDFTFKLVQVEAISSGPRKTFAQKFQIKLPQAIRSRHYDDVLFGADWRELLSDFDKQLLTCMILHVCKNSIYPNPASPSCLRFDTNYRGPAAPPAAAKPQEEKSLPPWVEPTTLESLLDKYNIEAKVPGRLAGTTWYVVQSKDRSGKVEPCFNMSVILIPRG